MVEKFRHCWFEQIYKLKNKKTGLPNFGEKYNLQTNVPLNFICLKTDFLFLLI